ncbi:hypothetical protein QO002_003697 [Pararhizobium capsulatum DSM 1112]|uniref:Uncharacterized protein n=1 Tax=Pararhizobium capsulatum DSM 1112 TaxID=1121113 RepID=A0ABU0BTI3_9HYPH|nr:hypothetical protein [Pararhizobium capsulatum DSM 1112]
MLDNGRRLFGITLIHIVLIVLVTIGAVTLVETALVALVAFLHLRLRGSNDAVVVFRVLEIVFSYHSVAGALCITGQVSIFFGDMLRGSTDLYIRTGAVIGARQRVLAFAVMVVIATTAAAAIVAAAVIVVTPTAALVLLSWPHRIVHPNSLGK